MSETPANPTEEQTELFEKLDKLINNGWKFSDNIWDGHRWQIMLIKDGEEPLLFPSNRAYQPRLLEMF